MPSAYIVRRNNATSVSYQVKYRLGGRSARIQHAGSFKTLREARARANWVRGEIAAMRVPDTTFGHSRFGDLTCKHAIQRMIDERVDATANTKRSWKGCLAVAPECHVSDFTVEKAQQWLTQLSTQYSVSSARVRVSALSAALDYVGVDPNPLQSNRVKLPTRPPAEAQPVLNQHWEQLQRELSPDNLAQARFIELTGIRRAEAGALCWKDVDLDAGIVLIRKGKTRSAKRVLRLRDWSHDAWNLLRSLYTQGPDDRLVFASTPEQLSGQLARISARNKWPRYGPHALRHRRATIWINAGVPPREVAYRLGHQNTSTTLDTYTHRSLETTTCAEESLSS